MLVVEAICEQTGLEEEIVLKVLEALKDVGIEMWSIMEIDGWYTDLGDLLSDSLVQSDEILTVAHAVEFDRFQVRNGEIL